MKRLILPFVLLFALTACETLNIKPNPEVTIPMDKLIGAATAIYMDARHDSSEVHKIADTIILMSENEASFTDIENYVVAEFMSSDLPFSAKWILKDYLTEMVKQIKSSATLWPDAQIYQYIIDLANQAKAIANMYDSQSLNEFNFDLEGHSEDLDRTLAHSHQRISAILR